MTYYKILQYCKAHGMSDGEAHYVRNMIRELVKDSAGNSEMVGHHRYSHNGACAEDCYYETRKH